MFLEQKFSNEDLQTFAFQTFVFQVLQECNSWASRNGAVQMFFLTPTRNMFFALFREYIFYSTE